MTEKMWDVRIPFAQATGMQTVRIAAESEQAAIAMVRSGAGQPGTCVLGSAYRGWDELVAEPVELSDASNAVIAALNAAFHRDPTAMHLLLGTDVPCNNALTRDEFVITGTLTVGDEMIPTISPMGLLNGALAAAGLPVVATKWTIRAGESPVLSGFCAYSPSRPREGPIK